MLGEICQSWSWDIIKLWGPCFFFLHHPIHTIFCHNCKKNAIDSTRMFMSGIYVMQMQKIKSNLYISLTFRKLTYLQRPVKLFYQTNQRDPYEPYEHLTLGSLYITDIWNPSQDDETPPVPPTLPLPSPTPHGDTLQCCNRHTRSAGSWMVSFHTINVKSIHPVKEYFYPFFALWYVGFTCLVINKSW